jgi:outer membrane protein
MKCIFFISVYARISISLLFFSQLSFAEDLQQIIKLAQIQDMTYQTAIHKASADKESYTQARSRFMPTVLLQYQDIRTNQNVVQSANFLSPAGSDRFGSIDKSLTISQPLFDLEIWTRFKQSKNTVNRADAELLQAKQALFLRTSEAYFLVLEREDQLATIRDEKTALSKHLLMAQQKKQAGLGRMVDVVTAEARYLESVAKELELESRLNDSHYALAEITGSVMKNLLRLSEQVEYQLPQPSNVQTWVDRANQVNPAIVAKEQALMEAGHEVVARRTKHFPTVNLSYTNGNVNTDESAFSDRSNIDSKRIQLRVDVPIFQGFYNSSRVTQAISSRYRAQDELRLLQRENERSVRDAFRRINASIMQIKALTRSVQAQENMLRLKTKGYQAGRYTLIEVLDAQKDYSNQQQGRTKARYDYVLNLLRLKASAGVITLEDIAKVNNWLTVKDPA